MADQTFGVSLSHLVEPLRLFHPTRVDGGVGVFIDFFVSFYSTQRKIVGWNKRSGSTKQVDGEAEVFIDFFISFYSTQRKIVGWNKRSGSTMTLHTPYKSGLSVK